jgi:AcrR family transcriptional regulator
MTEAGQSGSPRTLRRDAVRNRERLLVAARELFADHGFEVTLDDIAHHAGVGVGTVYRRFANKGELLDALFAEQTVEMAAAADTALADPDPWHGLVTYLETSLALQLRDKGLAQIVSGDRTSVEQHDWNREVMAPKNRALVARAQEAGMLRGDVTGTDLTFIQVALNAVMARSRHAQPDLYRRYLHLMLDGLRAVPGKPTPLPVAALTSDQTHAVMGPTRSSPTGAPQT